MQQRVITIALVLGLCLGLFSLAAGVSQWRLPDRETGYSPVQPIDYSHRLHANALQMDCRFCHSGAWRSRHAGIPSADVCMKCHKVMTGPFADLKRERDAAAKEKREPKVIVSDELKKLYRSVGLTDEGKPDPDGKPESIAWRRVHDLPDYVYFDHRAHVAVGVKCQKCHGPIETMERVRQQESLSMGWCVNCHRDANKNGINDQPVHASTDCAVCHY